MLIKEQIRKYKVKMDEIKQLEAAESIAFRRLSLLRQNTVSIEIKHRTTPLGRKRPLSFLGRVVLLFILACPFSKPNTNCKIRRKGSYTCPKL